jgi:DNA-binding response OmpR family regulator
LGIVLLVDDSPVARRVLADRLTAEGYAVREVGSVHGGRGLDATALASLACAVLDLELGDGDGTDLAASLLAKRPSLPIAFFSAGARPSLVESARARGPVFLQPDLGALVAWVKRAQQTITSYPPPTK